MVITQWNYHFRCISITISINIRVALTILSGNNKVGERETHTHASTFYSSPCLLPVFFLYPLTFHFVIFSEALWNGKGLCHRPLTLNFWERVNVGTTTLTQPYMNLIININIRPSHNYWTSAFALLQSLGLQKRAPF